MSASSRLFEGTTKAGRIERLRGGEERQVWQVLHTRVRPGARERVRVELLGDVRLDGAKAQRRRRDPSDSSANRLVAERLWSAPNFDARAVTVFLRVSPSHDETCADVIPTIDEHHPDWTEIMVVGVPATPGVRACFAPFEPGRFHESVGGFTYVRSPPR